MSTEPSGREENGVAAAVLLDDLPVRRLGRDQRPLAVGGAQREAIAALGLETRRDLHLATAGDELGDRAVAARAAEEHQARVAGVAPGDTVAADTQPLDRRPDVVDRPLTNEGRRSRRRRAVLGTAGQREQASNSRQKNGDPQNVCLGHSRPSFSRCWHVIPPFQRSGHCSLGKWFVKERKKRDFCKKLPIKKKTLKSW